MEETETFIPVNELRRLVLSIIEHRAQVCIRFRTIGQVWHPNFLRILKIEDGKTVLFHDEARRMLISLPDLSTIVQFELNDKLYSYEPNCHYQVSAEMFYDEQYHVTHA